MTITPYNTPYYTLDQIAELTGWSKHNVSQRAPLAKFQRIATGVYTCESVDRYLLARRLTEQAREDGYKSPHLLWPDANGVSTWEGRTYQE